MTDAPATDAGSGLASSATEASAEAVVVGETPTAPARPGRIRRVLRRIPRPHIRSRRGKLIAFILVAGFGSIITVGGLAVTQWTETADFCGRCHTMGPELKGHSLSAHRELSCAECHVEPGLAGWVKSKINGTRQLFEVVTGTFPTPIPPPEHEDLPPSSVTCRRCHDVDQLLENGGPIKLVLGARYRPDEANTRESIALVLRPAGFGAATATRGLHWHVVSDVEYATSDPRAQTIDLVKVTDADGKTETYVANNKLSSTTNAQPDIDKILAADRTARMDCIDCHNRVGHRLPTIDEAVDNAIQAGDIDPKLPFVKKEAVERLSADYPDETAAYKAIEDLRDFYRTKYPLVTQMKAGSINGAIAEMQLLYNLVATPELRVTGSTYPDNIGHQQYPGCLRCHDGGHYKVVDGVVTKDAIPSACATCHTFPQIGDNTSAILLGQRPDSHLDRLWVFNHTGEVKTLDPAGTSCGACHTRTYCENCHNTQAVNVPHNNMVFDHAAVVRQTGAQACVMCHQPTYCAQCHANPVLGGVTPTSPP